MTFKQFILCTLLLSTSNTMPMYHHIFQFALYPWLLFYNVIFRTKNKPNKPKRKHLSLTKDPSYTPKTFDFHHFNVITQKIDKNILEESFTFCPSPLKDAMEKRECSIKLLNESKSIQPCITRLLLHGPSWNGKTSLAYALAHKYKSAFAHISTAELYDRYDEGYIDIIDALIDPLTRENKSAIIIFESIHLLCNKEKIKDYPDKEAARYLLQKLKTAHIFNPHLLIIGITHAPEDLSPDYQEYFKNLTYQINPPSADKRHSIIKSFLFRNGFFDEKIIKKLIYETRNLPLGYLDEALHKARLYAEIDAVRQNRPPKRLALTHIDEAFEPFLNGKHIAKKN